MAPFLLILLASLRYLIQPIDGAMTERGGSKDDLIDPSSKPKFIKDVFVQTGTNALLPCPYFNSPGIITLYLT